MDAFEIARQFFTNSIQMRAQLSELIQKSKVEKKKKNAIFNTIYTGFRRPEDYFNEYSLE